MSYAIAINHIDIEVKISCNKGFMTGYLTVPDNTCALVIFSHGSGSSRHSPRNNYVASHLNNSGFSTLLLDLLLEEEAENVENKFDIHLLSERLSDAYTWSREMELIKSIPVGIFGASTGAAAAIELAGDSFLSNRDDLYAVVLRGGRTDLANKTSFEFVKAATLLIVGEHDGLVLEHNKDAYQYLHCKKRLEVIPEATHLFEQPGALEEVSMASIKWFRENLPH